MSRFFSICVTLVLVAAFAVAPVLAQSWKPECIARRKTLDDTQAKAAAAAAGGDQAGVCALIESLKNSSWLYCSCAADDEGPSKLAGCFKDLSHPAEEWKAKFNCPQADK